MAVQGVSRTTRRPSPGAQDLGQQVGEKAGEAIEKVSEQAKQSAATQKDRLVGGLGATANAIRQTGQNVRQQQPTVAEYAEKAAQRVDSVTEYLRQRDVDDVIGDVQDYARRNKAIFIGGTMLLGFMAARLVKTAGRRQQLSETAPRTAPRMAPIGITSSSPTSGTSPRYVPTGNSAMEIDPLPDEAASFEPTAQELAEEIPGTLPRARTNGH
ncbi:MAG: hypothetical protein M3077_01050 [Candidatus Dormibacteraeota bacterium]|nr:hypothetical protein [Candidatus Dormibacteraeota bacterium]